MKISIKQLDIYTNNNLISFKLDSQITFIYGNIGVGKTTLLSLILYCLGGDLVETPAVSDQFISAGLHIKISSSCLLLRREYKSSRIFISDNQEKVYNIDKREISKFLYQEAKIRTIYYDRKGVDTLNQITLKNFLWYSYLKQSDIDSNFFYLSKGSNEFYQTASMNTLASLLGKSMYVSEKQKKEISSKRKLLKKYENGMVALNYVINEDFLKFVNDEYAKIIAEYDNMKSAGDEKKDSEWNSMKASEMKLKILGRVISNYDKYSQEYIDLKKQVSELSSDSPKDNDSVFKENLTELGEIFKKCLISIGFPSISESDRVVYQARSLNPTLINEYTNTRYNFDLLGSGGKKTLFKICFLLAVHIQTQKIPACDNRLPSLIIIDTPMKNISEREDKDLFDNFYGYLLELSKTILSDTQLIIIDKEKNHIITSENAEIISINKEHPLFPEFIDANIWRKR